MEVRKKLLTQKLMLSIIIVSVLMAVGVLANSPRSISKTWGMPDTIPTTFEHLKVLELPREVARVDWLSRSRVESLDVSNCAIQGHLSGLPPTLKVLIAKNLRITHLDSLPDRLRSLDVRACDLTKIESLPQGLQVLEVGGNPTLSLVDLPPRLHKLIVEEMYPAEFARYPSELSELTIIGLRVSSWRGILPASLSSLTLISTRLKELPQLPASLTSLSLNTNELLKNRHHLPPYLSSFVTEGAGLDEVPELLSLNTLELRGPILPPDLPSGVESLSFEFIGEARSDVSLVLPPLPEVKKLAIINYAGTIQQLPLSLEELDLTGTPQVSLRNLPQTLRTLVVANRASVDFGLLPRSLRVLDISGVKEIKNASLSLPNLTTLIFRGSSGLLPALSEELEVLDVSDSPGFYKFPSIPRNLTELRLRGTGITELPIEKLNKLELLDVCQATIKGLKRLPNSLLGLRVSDGQLDRNIVFPPKLSHLAMRKAVDCNEDDELWSQWLMERKKKRLSK